MARFLARVGDIRKNAIHQASSAITKRHGIVVMEDLNVSGLMKNRTLAQAISDAGFAELRRQIEYKLAWTGGRFVLADRWFPSSKTCSNCGVVREKLRLEERVFHCPDCGFASDRDLNAAVNLRNVAGRISETENGCLRGEVQEFAPVLLIDAAIHECEEDKSFTGCIGWIT